MDGTLKSSSQLCDRNETKTAQCIAYFKRQDVLAWLFGMVYIAIIIGCIFGIGSYRGWDAQSGYTHNESLTSRARFWSEPFIEEPGIKGRHGAHASMRWYYWKLPPDQALVYTRLFVWICYASHQLVIWGVILKAQLDKSQVKASEKYSTNLSSFNYVALLLNALFHVLHLVQTHITYDALAQDVSIASSQNSVTMLLVIVALMEYRDRGLFFGWPSMHSSDRISKKVRLNYQPINLLRKYHGYAFAWASIYTYWYHPMENTWGHALGFIHTWMIMLQGSLIYTKVHLNRYWRLINECWVILHAGLVAYQTGGPDMGGTSLWPMFVFGFLLVFVLTQIFSLPFWRKLPSWCRLIPFLIYLGIVLWCYSWIEDKDGRAWVRINEPARIPSVYYLGVLITWAVLLLFLKIEQKFNKNKEASSTTIKVLCILGVVFVYALCIGLSILIEQMDLKIDVFVAIAIFLSSFIFAVDISSILLKLIFDRSVTLSKVGITKGSIQRNVLVAEIKVADKNETAPI